MLTANGKKLIKHLLCQNASYTNTSGVVITNEISGITLTKHDGTTIPITDMQTQYSFPNVDSLYLLNATTINPYTGLVFGSGTTPPTENDYKVEASVQSTNSWIKNNEAYCYVDDNDNICCDLTYLYHNNTNVPITICEYGLYSNITNSASSGYVLVYRDVLEEPITIEAGGHKIIKITLKMGLSENTGLTKNGEVYLKYILCNYAGKSFSNRIFLSGLWDVKLKNVDGVLYSISQAYYGTLFPNAGVRIFNSYAPASWRGASGLFFGSNNDSPTKDDYTIAYGFNGLSTKVKTVRIYNDENNNEAADMVYEVKNTQASNSITISEFGLINRANNSNNYCFLIYRDVLDTPVTVGPGETKNLKLTIKLNW